MAGDSWPINIWLLTTSAPYLMQKQHSSAQTTAPRISTYFLGLRGNIILNASTPIWEPLLNPRLVPTNVTHTVMYLDSSSDQGRDPPRPRKTTCANTMIASAPIRTIRIYSSKWSSKNFKIFFIKHSRKFYPAGRWCYHLPAKVCNFKKRSNGLHPIRAGSLQYYLPEPGVPALSPSPTYLS